MLPFRGYISPTPTTYRGGYQGPIVGYLERRPDGVHLVYFNGAAATSVAAPGRYFVCQAPHTNLTPRIGVKDSQNEAWLINPEYVVVDFLTGFATMPVVVGSFRSIWSEFNDAPDDFLDIEDADRVAARFVARDQSTGSETGSVKVEACYGGVGDFRITASQNITAIPGEGAKVYLGAEEAPVPAAISDKTDARIKRLEDAHNALVAAFKAHVHAGVTLGSAATPVAVTTIQQITEGESTAAEIVYIK